MQFIKAKYLKNGVPVGRSYTFKTLYNLSPGEIAVNDSENKLIVVDEPVDAEWIKVYGVENIAVLSRPSAEESEVI
jgi:hypothetical protein